MTDGLKAIIHKDLKWIVSMPLIPVGKFKSLGVLNIDGIADVERDELLLNLGAAVGDAVLEVANYLELQPSICVDLGEL